eukprot:gene10955-biopygen1715
MSSAPLKPTVREVAEAVVTGRGGDGSAVVMLRRRGLAERRGCVDFDLALWRWPRGHQLAGAVEDCLIEQVAEAGDQHQRDDQQRLLEGFGRGPVALRLGRAFADERGRLSRGHPPRQQAARRRRKGAAARDALWKERDYSCNEPATRNPAIRTVDQRSERSKQLSKPIGRSRYACALRLLFCARLGVLGLEFDTSAGAALDRRCGHHTQWRGERSEPSSIFEHFGRRDKVTRPCGLTIHAVITPSGQFLPKSRACHALSAAAQITPCVTREIHVPQEGWLPCTFYGLYVEL